MAMYAMTVTGEWGASDGHLLLGQVTCAFGAEGSVAAMETARDLLAALFIPPDKQPPALWQRGQRPAAALAGVLAVHVRYLDAEERAPRGFRRLLD